MSIGEPTPGEASRTAFGGPRRAVTSVKPHMDTGCRPVRLTLLSMCGADARHAEQNGLVKERRKTKSGWAGMWSQECLESGRQNGIDDDEIMLARRDFLKDKDFE